MKILIFVLFSAFGTLAFAGHTVCSSSNLYYNNIQHDFEIEPPVGTELETTLIVFRGEVLLKESRVSGLGKHGIDSHRVEFSGDRQVLETTGSPVSGASTYKQKATLFEVSKTNPSEEIEIHSETLVCQQAWALVP